MLSYLCKHQNAELAKEIWDRLKLKNFDRAQLNKMAKNRSALLSIYNQKYIIRILAPELRQNNIKNILKQFNERPTSDENDYYQVLLWKIKKTIRGKLSFSQRFLIDAGKGDEGGIFSETEILKSSGVVP